MKLSPIVQIAIAAVPIASGYAILSNGVQCHSGPGADYANLRAYAAAQDISLRCQTQKKDETWYKTSDACFVSAAHVSHPSSTLAVCDFPSTVDDDYASFLLELRAEAETAAVDAAAAAAVPGPVTNDYPYAGSCGGVDPWAFYKCQCTSFVAFRVNKRLGVKFSNQYKGAHWGDAKIWDEAARQSKVRIDAKPVPGCVAQTNAGAGHVAWVTKVAGDKVTVEEYNYVHKEAYGTRTVAKSTFSYIHIKV